MPHQKSQISVECNDNCKECLVYREDSTTKTHDSGLHDMHAERKIVWVYPSSDPSRCPVRLTKKYLSLCPPYFKKPNFYLRALDRPSPKQWYAGQVVGSQTLSKVIGKIMENGDFKGFFTNHSARRTGGTRLFRAGVQRKLVKECTGHRSDAVDKYQVTSDEQHEKLSEIIREEPKVSVSEVAQAPNTSDVKKSEVKSCE